MFNQFDQQLVSSTSSHFTFTQWHGQVLHTQMAVNWSKGRNSLWQARSGITLAMHYRLTTTTPQPSYGFFSGTTRVSRCQKRTSGLYGARGDKHTDHPAGRRSIRTNQCPPPPSPPKLFYGLDALPAAQPTVSKQTQCYTYHCAQLPTRGIQIGVYLTTHVPLIIKCHSTWTQILEKNILWQTSHQQLPLALSNTQAAIEHVSKNDPQHF